MNEPVRGAAAYPGLAALPGVQQLERFLAGETPAPPVARLTGRRIVAADHGIATYALPATPWMLGPKGLVHSGVLAMLADGALVAAVVSGLPPRTLCTTAELSMTFLATPAHGGGDVVAYGRLVHLDEQMGLAEVFVSDATGDLVAHGTSRCSVFPPIDGTVELVPPPPARDPARRARRRGDGHAAAPRQTARHRHGRGDAPRRPGRRGHRDDGADAGLSRIRARAEARTGIEPVCTALQAAA
jgi:uncharacterized protein (TIGR00369 family)